MKINGQSFKPPVEEVIFQRPGGEFIRFELTGVMSLDAFDAQVKAPQPPVIHRPGKADKVDASHPAFIEASQDYGKLRHAYLMAATLGSSPGVEWDTIKMDDSLTWENWRKELLDLGLLHFEIEQLTVAVMKANGLAGQMEEARDAFLATMAAQARAVKPLE